MNRTEFMKQLDSLLYDLPMDEREEALRFYEDYFDDGGGLEEERIIRELGTPEKVAKSIRNNVLGKVEKDAGEFTERGYEDPYDREALQHVAVPKKKENQEEKKEYQSTGYQQPKKDNTKIVLIIALVICSFPIWIGIVGGVFGLVVGLAGLLFGLVVGFGATFIGLLVGAVALLVTGIFRLFTEPATGCIVVGISFILGALSMVFLTVTIAITTKIIPAVVRLIADLCNKLYHGARKVSL